MDLVDSHMNVLVVFVAVAHRDVLVLRKPQCIHKPIHDVPELLPVEAAVLGMKRDDEVIRAVLARPGVLGLDGLDQPTGELDVLGGGHTGEVPGEEPGGSGIGAPAADVVSELTKALA
jgi:hypothetical protein